MPQKSIITISFATLTLLLLIGCQSLEEFNIFTIPQRSSSNQGPHSIFVAHQKKLQVDAGQPVPIETYHVSNNRLNRLNVTIDGQQFEFEADGQTATFVEGLVLVQFSTNEQPDLTWPVSLIWTAYTPGTYDLTIFAIDQTGQQSNPVVQRIEVK